MGDFFRQDSLQSEAEKSMKKATRCEKNQGSLHLWWTNIAMEP